MSYPQHSHVLIIPMFSTKAANATAPNAEFLAHGIPWSFGPQTQTRPIFENKEKRLEKCISILVELFYFAFANGVWFLIFGWLGSISKETNSVYLFSDLHDFPRKKAPHTPKNTSRNMLCVQNINIKSSSSRPPNVKDLSHDLLDKPFPILHTWLSHWPAPFFSAESLDRVVGGWALPAQTPLEN